MRRTKILVIALIAFVCASPLSVLADGAAGGSNGGGSSSLFTLSGLPGPVLGATDKPAKPAPLPLHTIEGVGGVAVTPMAYLVNPGPAGTAIGLPTFSLTYVNLGQKSIQTFAYTQTFWRRFEFGYALSRFDLGSLPHAIKKATTIGIRQDVYLHHLNLRALLIEENSWDLPLPAVTAGVHFKYNTGVRSINKAVVDLIGVRGYARPNGTDLTLTASKTFPSVFGRPVMASLGMRYGSGAQIGYLGFSNHESLTLEANVVCLVTDWLAIAYEYRQKEYPYRKLAGLLEDGDDWHVVAFGIVVNEHFTVSGGWVMAGNLFNAREDGGFAIQLKWEF